MAEEEIGINKNFMQGLENFLGQLETKARSEDLEYESRLAASLRDICKIYYPSQISYEQIKYFVESTSTLMKEWGSIDRNRLKDIRRGLLDVELNWLPVTDKAVKDISEIKSKVGKTE